MKTHPAIDGVNEKLIWLVGLTNKIKKLKLSNNNL